MQPVALPSGLRTARLVAFVQGALGIFTGALFVLGGPGFATALGLRGTSGTAVVIAAGVVLAVVSALVFWGARLLGRCSRHARVGLLVYEYVSVVPGIVFLASDTWQSALRIVLAAVVIYYLQVDRETRDAFDAPHPPAAPVPPA